MEEKSIVLCHKSSPIVFSLLQSNTESHCRGAAYLKVSEETVGVGGRRFFLPRGFRMGGGLLNGYYDQQF